MKTKIKSIAAIFAALALVFATTTTASATTPSLTYDQLRASAGYKAFMAADDISATNLAAFNQLRIDMQMDSSLSGLKMTSIHMNIDATKTASKVTLEVSMPSLSNEVSTTVFGLANNSYYQTVQDFDEEIPNLTAALTRLKSTKTSTLWLDTTVAPAGMDYADPAYTFDGSNVDPLLELVSNFDGYLFTEVTTGTDATDPSLTYYEFSMTSPSSGLLPAANYTMQYLYNAQGTMVSAHSTGGISSMNLVSEITFNISSPQTVNVSAPAGGIHLNTLIKTGKQIGAEKLVATKAKAIGTKAKALAGKKTLVAKHITDAAKALKYSVTNVKNGVKLTTKYQGVSGSMCVIATKGKAVIDHC